MKHLAQIQSEFLKAAAKWEDLSYEAQKAYLEQHRRSKKRLTKKPGQSGADVSRLEKSVPRKLFRNEIEKYFSHEHYDNLVSLWGHSGVKKVQDDNGKWYEASFDSGKMDGTEWNGSIRLKVLKTKPGQDRADISESQPQFTGVSGEELEGIDSKKNEIVSDLKSMNVMPSDEDIIAAINDKMGDETDDVKSRVEDEIKNNLRELRSKGKNQLDDFIKGNDFEKVGEVSDKGWQQVKPSVPYPDFMKNFYYDLQSKGWEGLGIDQKGRVKATLKKDDQRLRLYQEHGDTEDKDKFYIKLDVVD